MFDGTLKDTRWLTIDNSCSRLTQYRTNAYKVANVIRFTLNKSESNQMFILFYLYFKNTHTQTCYYY